MVLKSDPLDASDTLDWWTAYCTECGTLKGVLWCNYTECDWHITTLCDTLDWSRSSRYHTADVTTWLERDSPHFTGMVLVIQLQVLCTLWTNPRKDVECPKTVFCLILFFLNFFLVLEGGKSCCLKPRRHRPSLLTGFRLTCSFLLSIICDALHFLTLLHMIDRKSIADP